MRVITSLPAEDWKKVPDAAKAAEACGFDGVSTSELAHDPFLPLALAANATENARLVTSIALAFPRSPTITAYMAWDLQANSGGRFELGLGTQVKGHNERRFSVPWTSPVPRLREYVQAMRAVWRSWETGEKLSFEGEHYNLSLMTPEFSPEPTGLPMVPVTIAAVGPDMLRMGGRIADGVRLHGFCTRAYMENVCLARINEGLEKAGRKRENIEISGGGFIATGRDEEEVRKMMDWARYRVAFYGSTRTYHPVFAQHGLEDLGMKLHHMVKDGKWNEIAGEVSDDVVRLFAAIGTYDEIAGEIEQRYGNAADAIRLNFPDDAEPGLQREIVQDIRKIPSPFSGFAPHS